MTERQRDDDLLADLLASEDEQPAPHRAGIYDTGAPLLTEQEELRLLREANRVGTPTLIPSDTRADSQSIPASFSGEVVDFVRRHPVPTVLLAVGVAYVLSRRHYSNPS